MDVSQHKKCVVLHCNTEEYTLILLSVPLCLVIYAIASNQAPFFISKPPFAYSFGSICMHMDDDAH